MVQCENCGHSMDLLWDLSVFNKGQRSSEAAYYCPNYPTETTLNPAGSCSVKHDRGAEELRYMFFYDKERSNGADALLSGLSAWWKLYAQDCLGCRA